MDDEVKVEEKLGNTSVCISFPDNKLLPQLYGDQDRHLIRIEKFLNVSAYSRGNILSLSGEVHNVERAKFILETLYRNLQQGVDIGMGEVDAALRMTLAKNQQGSDKKQHSPDPKLFHDDIVVKTRKRIIAPYTNNQREYIKELFDKELVLAAGPAGTGKTYLAVAVAVSMFISHRVDRIILSRPAVEAGEKLGFLPGDMKEKVDPYLRPLYDALYDMLPSEEVIKYLETEQIEIAPLAFMRGRTLNNAFIILDEAQNATPTQMKMFLTRLGEGSRMAVSGDLSQTDLPRDVKSGLRDAWEKLHGIEDIACVRFTDDDVIRHPLTAKIVKAYEAASSEQWKKDYREIRPKGPKTDES